VTADALDVAANRGERKYSRSQNLRRILWACTRPLFSWSPRPFFAWRRFLLRAFGARIGRHVHVYSSAIVTMPWNLEIGDWSSVGEDALIYNLGRVTIGAKVTISHRAHLCAGSHDHTQPRLPLLKLPITVEDQAWICAGAFVGPNVTIGEGSVVGACAVVVRAVPPWVIVIGNPSRVVGPRTIRSAVDHDGRSA
jgi:putative colanic acid biosynthesis acetyltransferase WcaF